MTADPAIDDGWSEWPAPAKLNLFLRIVGRRDDGYHLLQTVFQILDWGDTIRLRLREDGAIRRTGNPVGYGVAEDEDLTIRAARLLQTETGSRLGCEIAVEKRIPLGGGFGGGSSDAATVLVALDRLWGTGLGTEKLSELGLRLGADVPVFVRGTNAWAEGIGEQLTQIALPSRWYLIVDTGVHASTSMLFGDPELTRDSPPTTIQAFVLGEVRGNAFEPLLRRREPAIAATLDALARFGQACLTGSGGGCFVAFESRAAAEAARVALPKDWRAWVAAGAERSPLLDRLERMD